MNLQRHWLICICVAIGAVCSPANAEVLPCFSVAMIADRAEFVAEGEWLGGDRVRIIHVHKASPQMIKAGDEITVAYLGKHNRQFNSPFDEEPLRSIECKRVALFLNFDAKAGNWRAMYTYGDGKSLGSCGVFWVDDDALYGYTQISNPGPYCLTTGDRVPASIALLRRTVDEALAHRAAWDALALADTARRAEGLSRYLLASTAPVSDQLLFLYCSAARKELKTLPPEDVVAALLQVAADPAPRDELRDIVGLLGELGPAAQAATPRLLELLDDRRVQTASVVRALGRIGDPRAIEPIRNRIPQADIYCLEAIAVAAAELQDEVAFDLIAARLPPRVDDGNQDVMSAILSRLIRLKRMQGEVLLDRYLADSQLDPAVRRFVLIRVRAHDFVETDKH